ncbi:MAG TPA: WD40 repeat domain-containing protein, partial [Myxococcales bacterium]|nr:WD40 repeat domain-containing protein [Myxococcales bacterium]
SQRGQLQVEPLWRLELPGSVDALAVSRDGRTVAVGLGGNQVAFFDAATGAAKRTIDGLDGKLTAMTFAPDGQTLATATDDRTLSIWNVESGDRVARADGGAALRDVQFSPDGAHLATAGADGVVRTWTAAQLTLLLSLKGHEGAVTSVDYAFDASSLVSSGDDGTLRLWTLPAGTMKIIRGSGHQPVSHVAFAASDTVISASNDGTVRFFSMGGDQLARINTSGGAVIGLAVPAIKGAIAALQQDAHALLIDPVSRLVVAQLEGDDAIGALGESADGTALVTASRDGRLRGWKVTPGARELRLRGASDFAGGTALAVAPKRAAVGDQAGHITLWNIVSGQPDSVLDLAQGPVTSLAFTKDGKYLAASGHEDKAFIFETSHGNRVVLEGHTDLVNAVALSPDGATVATGSADGSVRLWAMPNGQQKRTLTASGMGPVLTVAFSPDGTQLAAAGEDKTIRVWELSGFKLVHRFEGSPASVLSLAFSPHGSILASAGGDEAIRTWRLSNGKLRSVWLGHGAHVFSIAFAPDGETLASASLDGTIRMWDVRSGRQVSELARQPEARSIAFTA